MGSRHRQAGRQRHRLAGPPHGADICDALRAGGHADTVRAQDRARHRRVFLRHQAASGCSTTSTGARARAERGELAFGTVDTWLIWKLTGGARTSPMRPTPAARCSSTSTPAIGTTSCCALLDIPRAVLPSIVRLVGRVCAESTVAGVRMPIAGIAGDQQAALFGQACLAPGPRQEHLRHRLLPAAQHRARSRRVHEQAAHDRGVEARRA